MALVVLIQSKSTGSSKPSSIQLFKPIGVTAQVNARSGRNRIPQERYKDKNRFAIIFG
jgi:hypothetical protein